MADIIVIGGGPAGMTAALYALRNGKSVLILEKHGFGGQITYSPKVENWPGTAQMSGNEFADALLEQVMNQGAEVDLAEVLRVEDRGETKAVFTDDGKVHEAKALVIATGVKHRMLGLPGENELVGEGISFCAVCDGDFYSGQTVCVAGGGNSALQQSDYAAGSSGVYRGEKTAGDPLCPGKRGKENRRENHRAGNGKRGAAGRDRGKTGRRQKGNDRL